MSGLSDETVDFLRRVPPTHDLDDEPDPDHPGYLALPADADPAAWDSLDRVVADLGRALPFEEWLQQEAEDG
jgi:hypothetical protein